MFYTSAVTAVQRQQPGNSREGRLAPLTIRVERSSVQRVPLYPATHVQLNAPMFCRARREPGACSRVDMDGVQVPLLHSNILAWLPRAWKLCAAASFGGRGAMRTVHGHEALALRSAVVRLHECAAATRHELARARGAVLRLGHAEAIRRAHRPREEKHACACAYKVPLPAALDTTLV